MTTYLDTSAAMKLVVEEPESAGLAGMLDGLGTQDRIVSSWLLHAELHCAVGRHPAEVSVEAVESVLSGLVLVDLVRVDLIGAAQAGRGLRSQDAIHLTVALRIGAEAIVTYDEEQAAAARAAGLLVLQPA